jgi:hypothetical protein
MAGDAFKETLSEFGTGEDFTADFASWMKTRTPQEAARELLAFAAVEGAATRTAAVEIVYRLGAAAGPAWREALDRPELRCYAKAELLAQMTANDLGQQEVPAELALTVDDLAWFFTDKLAPAARLIDPNMTVPFDPTQIALGKANVNVETLFDAMARLDHPDAEAVLAMLGNHCDDRETAKAARKAGYQAASHRAGRRS